MRKTLTVAIILGLLAGALAAPAEAQRKKKKKAKKIERQIEGSYEMPALVIVGTCAQQGAIGCVTFGVAKGEKFITELTITDQHGLPVYAQLAQNLDGDNQWETNLGSFCGELDEPVEFTPGHEVAVWVLTPSQDPTCLPGQGTSGTVDITVSNRK